MARCDSVIGCQENRPKNTPGMDMKIDGVITIAVQGVDAEKQTNGVFVLRVAAQCKRN